MFWRLTLREIAVILKGFSVRLEREHNDRAWLAWHVAALPRAKKFPALKDMQTKQPRKVRRKTPEEMLSIAHMWSAATRH